MLIPRGLTPDRGNPYAVMPMSGDRAVLILRDGDNVAVALRELPAGYRVELARDSVATRRVIPAGHKLATCEIAAGDLILKYGETMGRATESIAAGDHVHVHNVEGLRGRGDLAAAEGA